MHRIEIPKGWRLVDDRDSEELQVARSGLCRVTSLSRRWRLTLRKLISRACSERLMKLLDAWRFWPVNWIAWAL